jgi:hypothetical protein
LHERQGKGDKRYLDVVKFNVLEVLQSDHGVEKLPRHKCGTKSGVGE